MTHVRPGRLLLAVLLVASAFAVAFAVARQQREPSLDALPSRAALPPAVAAATAAPAGPAPTTSAPAASADGVARALRRVAASDGFGGRLLARVLDAATGAVLYDRAGDTPAAPASTAKLLTAAALLADVPATARFTTSVVDAGNGTIVLVGGGDPTLSGVAPGDPTVYPGAARISDLAARVRAAGTTVRRIVVDATMFTGPSVSPDWDPADMGTGYGGAITALMADGGRAQPDDQARSIRPDLDVGTLLARAIGRPGLPVTRATTPTAAGARVLASVVSAPVVELLDQMLQESDNVIADVLARQVAVAEHAPASFRGATRAIASVLARLGVRVGAGMKDGSGLASGDRVSPAVLAGVLGLVAGPDPRAARLRVIASLLPVAGWSGTMVDRQDRVAGLVRAKTGTLSTVSSLAGLVHDRSGRLLVFAFDADRVVGTISAEAALDAAAQALARCGCG